MFSSVHQHYATTWGNSDPLYFFLPRILCETLFCTGMVHNIFSRNFYVGITCNYIITAFVRNVHLIMTIENNNEVWRFGHIHPTDATYVRVLIRTGDRSSLYTQITSAAESGMDFSSRWLRDGYTFSSIDTHSIVPVDLNAILCSNEATLANLYAVLGTCVQHFVIPNGPSEYIERNAVLVLQKNKWLNLHFLVKSSCA